MTDVIFHIQRFSLHDGPGIRTSVFLKGCPMRCLWCHNPEGQNSQPEIRYFPDRCIACGNCAAACPYHAHEMTDGNHVFLRERCEVDLSCVETCYSQAIQLNGRCMTIEEVMEEIVRDQAFYNASGGGVTLTGGEPAMKGDFIRTLLQLCKERGIHTAIETCGEYPWAALEELLPFIDLLMMDIKQIDASKHQMITGKSNRRILSNARRLASTNKPIIFRTPVVPTVNDSEEDIRKIASFIQELIEGRKKNVIPQNGNNTIQYELLAFHKLAADKYLSLGLTDLASAIEPPTKEKMTELVRIVQQYGIEARFR
ncbi:MAG: glycyl-radical enzyme activating protein [bacterium]